MQVATFRQWFSDVQATCRPFEGGGARHLVSDEPKLSDCATINMEERSWLTTQTIIKAPVIRVQSQRFAFSRCSSSGYLSWLQTRRLSKMVLSQAILHQLRKLRLHRLVPTNTKTIDATRGSGLLGAAVLLFDDQNLHLRKSCTC